MLLSRFVRVVGELMPRELPLHPLYAPSAWRWLPVADDALGIRCGTGLKSRVPSESSHSTDAQGMTPEFGSRGGGDGSSCRVFEELPRYSSVGAERAHERAISHSMGCLDRTRGSIELPFGPP